MVKLIHISDLHIHGDNADNGSATSALDVIATRYPSHHIVLTGDVTDDGSPAQYRNAVELLRPLRGRLSVCPGNHDYGPVGNFHRPICARDFDKVLCGQLEIDGEFQSKVPVTRTQVEGDVRVLFIGLNSNIETTHPFDFARGEIGAAQLRDLDTLMSAPSSAGHIKVIYLHHHPFVREDPFVQLIDAEALMRVLYQRADLLLFGHRHNSGIWENRCGVRMICAADSTSKSMAAREIEISAEGIMARDINLDGRTTSG